jgi:hypothetical protein
MNLPEQGPFQDEPSREKAIYVPTEVEAILGDLKPILLEASDFIYSDEAVIEETPSSETHRSVAGNMPIDLYQKFAITTAGYLVQEKIDVNEERQAKVDSFIKRITEGLDTTLTLNFSPSTIIGTAEKITRLRGFSDRVIPGLNELASDPESAFGLVRLLAEEDKDEVVGDDQKAVEALNILYAFNGFNRVQYSALDLSTQLKEGRFDSYIAVELIETVMSQDPDTDNSAETEIRKMVQEHTQVLIGLGLTDAKDLYKRLANSEVIESWRDKAKQALSEKRSIYVQDMSYSQDQHKKFLKAHGCENLSTISEDRVVALGIDLIIRTAHQIQNRTNNITTVRMAAMKLARDGTAKKKKHDHGMAETAAKKQPKPMAVETRTASNPNNLLITQARLASTEQIALMKLYSITHELIRMCQASKMI